MKVMGMPEVKKVFRKREAERALVISVDPGQRSFGFSVRLSTPSQSRRLVSGHMGMDDLQCARGLIANAMMVAVEDDEKDEPQTVWAVEFARHWHMGFYAGMVTGSLFSGGDLVCRVSPSQWRAWLNITPGEDLKEQACKLTRIEQHDEAEADCIAIYTEEYLHAVT